jgi:hypothetical protein
MAEADFPDEAVRRAWARALRHTDEPVRGHGDARVVALPSGIIATVAVDQVAPDAASGDRGGRYARVTVRREDPPLSHDEAVPVVAMVYLHGRFEPFPVECVVGADGKALHYTIDLEAYKTAKAQDHIANAAAKTGADAASGDAEIAAMQLTAPLWALARTWDLDKVKARDERTMIYLSDRFLVPLSWIQFQVEVFLAELAEGAIDEHGIPRDKPGD